VLTSHEEEISNSDESWQARDKGLSESKETNAGKRSDPKKRVRLVELIAGTIVIS
jgi:hypothetical protein